MHRSPTPSSSSDVCGRHLDRGQPSGGVSLLDLPPGSPRGSYEENDVGGGGRARRPVVRARVRPAKGTIEAGRVRRVALPCVSRSHQGVLRRRQAQGRRMQRLPRRHGRSPGGHEEAARHQDRSCDLRRLSPEPVQVVRADGFSPHGTIREEAGDRARPRPRVRPSHDAARLHQGAQPAARPHVRAARPVHRRSRVRRPLRAEGFLALSRGGRRPEGLGHRRRPVSRQQRPEAFQAGHRGSRKSRMPVLQDAGPHPRLGVHGRPGADRQVEPDFQGRRDGAFHEPRDQLHLLPRPACRQAAHRA